MEGLKKGNIKTLTPAARNECDDTSYWVKELVSTLICVIIMCDNYKKIDVT